MSQVTNRISKGALLHIVNHLSTVVKAVDATRITMRMVRIRRYDQTWLIESTDGHRWVTNSVPLDEVQSSIDGDMCIRAEELDYIKLILKSANKYMLDSETLEVGERLTACDNYPDTESLRPRHDSGHDYEISFNAEYLEEMLRAMRSSKRQAIVKLKIKAPMQPVVVSCGGSSFGVLMPCRGDRVQWGRDEDEQAAS